MVLAVPDAGARLPKTDMMLLGLLASRSMHGYELAEHLGSARMNSWVRMGRTSIYYSLGRLEKSGLVSKHSERHGGKPERTVYSITETGRVAFISGLESALGTSECQTDDFDVALYFAATLDAPRTTERIEQRLGMLEDQVADLGGLAVEVQRDGDRALALVLEHRLAVLRADIDFLAGYVSMLRSGDAGAPSFSGALGDTSIAEALKNLEAAGRSGVVRVRTPAGEAGLAFEQGRLYGVIAVPGASRDETLSQIFSCARGGFEFEPSMVLEADAEPISGLTEALLLGGRGVTDSGLIGRMVPDPDVILDLRSGYELELVGLDITDEEGELLSRLDGVRTLGEVARELGWPTDRLKTVAYPLWLEGWIVRTDRSKRDLVLAVSRYVSRWCDAITLFAGERGIASVFADVERAAGAAGILDFRGLERTIHESHVRGNSDDLADQARRYVELMYRAVAARLGDGFAEDASRGFTRELPQDTAEILETHGVMV